jgi:hypothetical protein
MAKQRKKIAANLRLAIVCAIKAHGLSVLHVSESGGWPDSASALVDATRCRAAAHPIG